MENKPSVLTDRYEVGRLLGQGTFAKVYYGRSVHTNESVAIKMIDKEKVLRVGLSDQIKREISVMRIAKHPNVVSLHEVMATKSRIYFVIEYCKGGELFNKVKKGKLREDVAWKYFHQLINAVDFCHSRGVYHRDIKPENLLLDDNENLKVSDFGLSALADCKRADGLLHTTCGTPAYVAPEVINRKGYDGTKADIWSCGVVLFVLLAGYLPFHDSNLMEMYRKIGKADFKCPNWFAPEAKRLLCKMLDPNHESRISIARIRESSWFRKGLHLKQKKMDKQLRETTVIPTVEVGESSGSSSENGDSLHEEAAAQLAYLNAFDIISLSAGFDLGGLFGDANDKRESRFASRKPAAEIISKLEEVARGLNLNIRKQDAGLFKLEGSKEGRKGALSMDAEIFQVTQTFHLVEVKKCDGDTVEYQRLVEEDLRPALGDVVWVWQGDKEKEEQHGNCEVDEKTLTGEAFPVPKQRDSTVWAGTINLNGYISVKTTALASDCVVTKMAKLVEEAQSSKTKSQRLIDKCSQYYTPAIIFISGCIAAVPAIMKVHNLNHWFHLALVVLVSACPCGLILSTPVATFCALTKAATSGLLIKSADYLDILSKIKITAFDKTGTITRGEFIVVDFKSLHRDISLRTLLYWASSVESKSSHPMAATIVDYAKSVDVEPRTEEVEDYQLFPGEGIYGKIDGNDIYIGNKRIASRAKCSTVPEIEVDTKGGKTVGYIYVGERLAGVFNLSDACRSGVIQAMKELKDLGIKTAMLTGDNQDAAMHAQEQLGNALDVVHGELLPEDKSRIIQEFKKEGPTAMVGDGVNDAPALATADIGISMGISGSALATQTGDIILMSNDIRRIPQAIKIARRARRKVVQNVFISIIFKVGILILAICGHPLIWAAVLVDVGTCLLVILNSMLLLREKDKSKNKKCYRSSVLNGKKLEGEADEEVDLEAGLLSKSQCNSGCCGDKKTQEKVVMKKPSSKSSSGHDHAGGCCGDKKTQEKVMMVKPSSKSSSGHGHSGGCCGDKKTQEKVVMMRPSSKSSADHGHSGGCCSDKKTQEKVVMVKPSSESSSDHGHSGGCCGDKKQENVKVLVKDSCCAEKTNKPVGDMASSSSCKKSTHVHNDLKQKGGSGCCTKDKEKAEKNVEMQILGEGLIDLEKGLQKKAGETCKTSCCGTKEKAKETSSLEKDVLIKETVKQTEEITLASEEETGSLDCWLDSWENKTTVKRSCHEETSQDIEAGVSCDLKLACCGSIEGGEVKEKLDLEIKSEGQCKSVCCGDEKQTGEITLACEEESGCCGNKEEVGQICHQKDCLETDLKLVCCGNTDGEVREAFDLEKGKGECCGKEVTQICSEKPVSKSPCCGTGLKQEGSSSSVNVVESGSKEREMVKVPSQSCCTSPNDLVLQVKKVESCCKVKTPEACGSKCKVKDKRHIGKSCCRSYAKAYCTHRHHHHHHHHGHHHHHHVGAA